MSETALKHGKQEINAPFRVKSAGISLIVTLIIGMYYFANAVPLLGSEQVIPDGMVGLIITTIILSIVVTATLQITLFVGAGQIEDETQQDRVVSAKSNRNAHGVLSAGVIVTVGSSIVFGLNPFQMINVLLFAFLLSEVVQYASQLVYYRHNA